MFAMGSAMTIPSPMMMPGGPWSGSQYPAWGLPQWCPQPQAGFSNACHNNHEQHRNDCSAVVTRRTIYIADIDDQVSEAALAEFFQCCGNVVDCRMCADEQSQNGRFAFIEFQHEYSVTEALKMQQAVCGRFALRIQRSTTAMQRITSNLLPKTERDHERCTRTVHVTNICPVVEQRDLVIFFERFGEGSVKDICVLHGRRGGKHSFVEFQDAKAAQTALACSGALLGSCLIRVSPSKTPIRRQLNSKKTNSVQQQEQQQQTQLQ